MLLVIYGITARVRFTGNSHRGLMTDYTQPFSVLGSKGRFRYARYGYVPALELAEEPPPPPEPTPEWFEYNRLSALILSLQNRMNKHIDAAKRVSNYD